MVGYSAKSNSCVLPVPCSSVQVFCMYFLILESIQQLLLFPFRDKETEFQQLAQYLSEGLHSSLPDVRAQAVDHDHNQG